MTLMSVMLLIILGMVVGFFAGLLGIGGGAVMVPALTAYFIWQGQAPETVVHLALATSMSCIVFTAMLSIYTHHKHHAIIWSITRSITPAVLLGSALATYWVVHINSKTIALVFMVLMFLVALQLIIDIKPQKQRGEQTEQQTKVPIPNIQLLPTGFIIGFISAMIAIGGGSLTVPYLTWHQVNIKKAIATAASIGFPLALAGTLVYLWQTTKLEQTPQYSIGYIYWPATLAIVSGSLITTSLGAKLTHILPVKFLKSVFALLVMILALKMYMSIR